MARQDTLVRRSIHDREIAKFGEVILEPRVRIEDGVWEATGAKVLGSSMQLTLYNPLSVSPLHQE